MPDAIKKTIRMQGEGGKEALRNALLNAALLPEFFCLFLFSSAR